MILLEVESHVFISFKTMGPVEETWMSGCSCTEKKYRKDKLTHFIEEKLSNTTSVLPGWSVGLLPWLWCSSFWFNAVNRGGSVRWDSRALTSQGRSAGGRWQQHSHTGLDRSLPTSEFDSLFQLWWKTNMLNKCYASPQCGTCNFMLLEKDCTQWARIQEWIYQITMFSLNLRLVKSQE